jgi:predicted transcriptional regulator
MAGDASKAQKYVRILNEIEKFRDPNNEQRLESITKTLAMTKQNLNYYLQRFVKMGLIEHIQEQPYSVYLITGKGLAVKENLVQSEKGVKTVTWRYHNLVGLYKIFTWGSWRFSDRKKVPMNNWNYQIVKAPTGLSAHVQDTGTIRIYGPKLYGQDGEVLRIKATAMIQETARWFVDHFDMQLSDIKICRKGEKELLKSQQLAKLLGRVKTDEIFVNASGGDENLEEPDDSFAVENLLHNLEETPMRLTNIEQQVQDLAEMMKGFVPQQLALSNAVNYAATAIKNLQENSVKQTEILERMSSRTRDSYTTQGGYRASTGHSERQIPRKTNKNGLERFSTTKKIEIEIIKETPKFSYMDGGAELKVNEKYPGARIWLPGDVAKHIIKDGYAKVVEYG